MGVPPQIVVERVAEVAEDLEVVFDLWRTPDLHGVPDTRVAGGPEPCSIVALNGPVGRCRASVLETEVRESGLSKWQPNVASERVRFAVSSDAVAGRTGYTACAGISAVCVEVSTGAEFYAAAGAIFLELEIHDASDCVRAVLRRCTVTKHLGLPQCDRWDDRNVWTLRAVRNAVAEPGDDRGAVTALAVHQDERVVGCQIAQVHRSDDRGRIADRLRVDIEGGDQGSQLVRQVAGTLPYKILEGDGVNRYDRLGYRSRLRTAPDHDDPLDFNDFFFSGLIDLLRLGRWAE